MAYKRIYIKVRLKDKFENELDDYLLKTGFKKNFKTFFGIRILSQRVASCLIPIHMSSAQCVLFFYYSASLGCLVFVSIYQTKADPFIQDTIMNSCFVT